MRRAVRMSVAVAICATLLPLAGCGSSGPGCDYHNVLQVGPGRATADHTAAAPGNQVQFTAAIGEAARSGAVGCAVPQVQLRVNAVWTVSDPIHVQVSSAQGATNGLATCLGATDGPVTVTASYAQASSATLTGTASLTCQ